MRPACVDRDRPRAAHDRAFDRASEPDRREVGLGNQFDDPQGSQPFRSQLLLGFPFGREGHDHGWSAGGENVKHGVVSRLAHRDATAPQHLREFQAIAFEDHAVRQSTRQRSECLLRQVGSREQTPSETGEAAASPGLEGR